MSVWVPILLASFLFALIRQFGARGDGTLSTQTHMVGTVGLLAVCALALWVAGVNGLVVTAIASWLVMPLLADVLLFPVLRRGTRTTFWDFRSFSPRLSRTTKPVSTVEHLLEHTARKAAECRSIAQRADISRVLAAHHKAPEDIQRIRDDIAMIGLGDRSGKKVVSDAKLLEEHYSLEAAGVERTKLAVLYMDRFGSP